MREIGAINTLKTRYRQTDLCVQTVALFKIYSKHISVCKVIKLSVVLGTSVFHPLPVLVSDSLSARRRNLTSIG